MSEVSTPPLRILWARKMLILEGVNVSPAHPCTVCAFATGFGTDFIPSVNVIGCLRHSVLLKFANSNLMNEK